LFDGCSRGRVPQEDDVPLENLLAFVEAARERAQ
jgi:hypothetical protein